MTGGNPAWHGQRGQRWRNVKPCPSEAAYKRHLRHGEVPCEEDYAEVSRVTGERRAARRAGMSQAPDKPGLWQS